MTSSFVRCCRRVVRRRKRDIRAATERGCGFSTASLRSLTDARGSNRPHSEHMRRSSYAVWWTEGESPRHAGKMELGSLHAFLSGNGGGRIALSLDDIVSVEYAHGQ